MLISYRRSQFYRKIGEWGYKKNIRKSKIPQIDQNLSSGISGLANEFRDPRIDPTKIPCEQKQHELGPNTGRHFLNGPTTGKCFIVGKNPCFHNPIIL
jgi:hypothetical protein